MRLIDMHCDTLWRITEKEGEALSKNAGCIDLEKLEQAGSMAQFFACFIQLQKAGGAEAGYKKALEMIAYGKQQFETHSHKIGLARNMEDVRKLNEQGRIAAFLTVEEGGILNEELERLEQLYNEGISMITLMWNHENCIGFPNSVDAHVMQSGLKSFGIETVRHMNALGMYIDVSHMSDGCFWDTLQYSRKPVIASHSNARALCSHPRNLSDDMIKGLAEKGGVMGVNFYPYFLNRSGIATSEDIANHVEYIYRIAGEDVIAIGTDFDGYDDGVSEVLHIGQMEAVYHAVKRRGFTERQMDKIWAGNVIRVLNA